MYWFRVVQYEDVANLPFLLAHGNGSCNQYIFKINHIKTRSMTDCATLLEVILSFIRFLVCYGIVYHALSLV